MGWQDRWAAPLAAVPTGCQEKCLGTEQNPRWRFPKAGLVAEVATTSSWALMLPLASEQGTAVRRLVGLLYPILLPAWMLVSLPAGDLSTRAIGLTLAAVVIYECPCSIIIKGLVCGYNCPIYCT